MAVVFTVPKHIRETLGPDGSDELVELLNNVTEANKANIVEFVSDKFQRTLTEVHSQLNERITTEVSGLNQKITEVESRLEIRISESKAEIIRWMFVFWVGQFLTMIGLAVTTKLFP